MQYWNVLYHYFIKLHMLYNMWGSRSFQYYHMFPIITGWIIIIHNNMQSQIQTHTHTHTHTHNRFPHSLSLSLSLSLSPFLSKYLWHVHIHTDISHHIYFYHNNLILTIRTLLSFFVSQQHFLHTLFLSLFLSLSLSLYIYIYIYI